MRHAPHLLHDFAAVSAARLPAKTAVIADGRSYCYEELFTTASRLAGALRERGLAPGDRVAIFMDNSWPCVVSVFSVLMAGGVFLLVNPQTKREKLGYILNDSGAAALIAARSLEPVFLPLLSHVKSLTCLISAGAVPQAAPAGVACLAWEEAAAAAPFLGPAGSSEADLASLIYTSGTTGTPKGVMMTHRSMVFAAGCIAGYLRLDETDRILNVLPLAFDYGLYQLLMSVYLGATLVLERSFTYPAHAYRQIERHGVTVFPGVPTIFATMIAQHKKTPLCFPSVTRLTNTAADLPANFTNALREIFPAALLFRMYGLTECKRVCYLEPELALKKPTSVGKAMPGTEVFLRSPDGKPVKPGEAGILHVRGPHLMRGYWNRPELSQTMLVAGEKPGERVLCTHDWFTMDEEGFLYFKGRSDDIIKTRGEKVSPLEVENALYGIPGITEAAVVGVPDEILGQALVAFVAVAGPLTEKEIISCCAARLENFMVPKKIIFRDALPKTATGKIRKKDLLQTPL
ncbi:MAG: AMP-binding protein [Chitinivibrionales bacterium]|nr:AMP-binding protein [Chitinivibrionales bacterium]